MGLVVFALLVQETLWDLCKDFCPQGQHPSLGSRASIVDRSPDPSLSLDIFSSPFPILGKCSI